MSSSYIIAGARLLNPRENRLGVAVNILIDDGIIMQVSPDPIRKNGFPTLDAAGYTVAPGLIDAHVHIFMNQMNIAALGDVPQTYATVKASNVLRGMLDRGFTSVRDVAGGDFGMRDAEQEGLLTSPRLFVGGRAVSQTGGHGDFRGRMIFMGDCGCSSGLALFSRIADGVDDMIKATRQELRLGADHIKIMLSGGVASPHDPLESIQYRLDEIKACVEEAERWGKYVCAHAYLDVAIRRAVESGVRTIEHGNFVSDETAALMAEKNVFVVPTQVVHEINTRLGAKSGKSPQSMEKNEVVRVAGREGIARFKKAGVKIGLGTDLSGHTQQYQTEGLSVLAEVIGSADALRSATIINAEILGMQGRLGELVPGAHADLLLIKGDPYEDITILEQHTDHIAAVMKGGKFHKLALPVQ